MAAQQCKALGNVVLRSLSPSHSCWWHFDTLYNVHENCCRSQTAFMISGQDNRVTRINYAHKLIRNVWGTSQEVAFRGNVREKHSLVSHLTRGSAAPLMVGHFKRSYRVEALTGQRYFNGNFFSPLEPVFFFNNMFLTSIWGRLLLPVVRKCHWLIFLFSLYFRWPDKGHEWIKSFFFFSRESCF